MLGHFTPVRVTLNPFGPGRGLNRRTSGAAVTEHIAVRHARAHDEHEVGLHVF